MLKDEDTYMATVNINVRVDSELKSEAEALFTDLGMNMSTAITIFLKSAVSHNGIPFEIRRYTPNAATRAVLAEYAEMLADPQKYRRYDSFADLLKEVLDEDV